ncbi:MAG: hypothetical protein ABSG64_13520 [Solirubrobacteraceae bacterium]
MTFISADSGWVLGTTPCGAGGACLGLRETTDAGRAWVAQPLPAALVAAADRKVAGVVADLYDGGGLNVRFADTRDGWIYGSLPVSAQRECAGCVNLEPTLWSTHDGGAVWHKQPLSGLGSYEQIFDLEASGGTAYLMATNDAQGVSVKSSPVTEDHWQLADTPRLGDPAGGGEQSGAFVLQGASGWLVEGNDRGTTGSAQLDEGQWVSWTPPCASLGGSFAIPAAASARNLVAVCVMGGFASPLPKSAPPGAKLGSSWLYFSSNGGQSFVAGPELAPGTPWFSVLASPTPRSILIGRGIGNSQELAASFDGGVHWTVVYHGQPLYLAFTTPRQGVAIVGSLSGPTKLIMTFDGGQRWTAVSF